MFSVMLLPPRQNEQELEGDITKILFSLLSSLSMATQCADVTPESFCRSRICSSPPSPSLSLSLSAVAQVITCGSQDWLANWGRHCEMTGGPGAI